MNISRPKIKIVVVPVNPTYPIFWCPKTPKNYFLWHLQKSKKSPRSFIASFFDHKKSQNKLKQLLK
jgi:hypothetical protein